MRYLIVLFAVFAMASAHKRGFRIRFDTGLPWNMGKTYFYEIPLYVTEIKKLGWTQHPRADDHLPSLELWCPSDPIFCAMYDPSGFIAGMQLAVPQDKFSGAKFDWKIQGFTEWEPVSDGKRYWTTQQFLVDETYLALDENTRIVARNKNKKTLQTDGIWVRGHHGKLLKISSTKEGIDKSEFTKQACIPWMGTHYYYNMTKTTECTSEGVLPWFPLVSGGELVGTGVMTFGKLPIEKGKRDWFERPNKMAVKAIVPRAPSCLYDLPNNPGLVTMHIYYIDDPRFLLCVL